MLKEIAGGGGGYLRSKFSEIFYKIFNFISDVKIESNVRDFRLMDKSVIKELVSMNEYHRFSKSMFAWVGFSSKCLTYDYEKRSEGSSKWSFYKLFNYAIEGFVSFSTVPLRIAFILGLLVSFFSFIYGAYIVIDTLMFGNEVKGYASTITVIMFLGGMQLLVLGIIGEYIARIYEQVKNRPHYIVEEEIE